MNRAHLKVDCVSAGSDWNRFSLACAGLNQMTDLTEADELWDHDLNIFNSFF